MPDREIEQWHAEQQAHKPSQLVFNPLDFVLMCPCGKEQMPVIVSPGEVLYMCEDSTCPHQINLSTLAQVRLLEERQRISDAR